MTQKQYNPFSLENKTVLITGASSGIGRATAIECSKMGAKVCITGRNKQRLNQTFDELEGEGHIQALADLREDKQIEELVEGLPTLDGVVHCAGVIMEENIPSFFLEKDDILNMLQSNLFQIMSIDSLLIQNRQINKGASIVHISSTVARIPVVGLAPYNISKASLISYSQTLATELVQKNIRVNVILPAMIDTEIVKQITKDNPYFDKYKTKYPFGYGKPEDVAWSCIYLLSNAGRWITGSEFVIDGGSYLQWK